MEQEEEVGKENKKEPTQHKHERNKADNKTHKGKKRRRKSMKRIKPEKRDGVALTQIQNGRCGKKR